MDTRKAQLQREWEAHTDDHKRELGRAIETFDAFETGETVDPLAIVGAFRSGKTQLMYHLFDQSWDRGIPAFYIGDPGAMLENYESSDVSQIDDWIEMRIDEQLEAFAEGDTDDVDWFPNVDSATKEEFVATRPTFETSDDVEKTALFFDEVEQSYRDFMRVMDKDDDNPLRKINDSLQDSIKVWSFGMISAFEFIGEADWGRMKEIRIPPLSVRQVRNMLEEQRPEATFLANTIWWLARGRTGLIIKLVDELPGDIAEEPEEWLRDRAEADFKDTRLINTIWTSLDRDDWDAATRALLFKQQALDSWVEEDEEALAWDQCQSATVNITQDAGEFSGTEEGGDAVTILDRNAKRVFQGLATTEDGLFPRYGLADEEEADALLDLISNMVVSFEPNSPARSLALETLDELKGEFQTAWLKRVANLETTEQEVTSPKPSKVRDAFPPIAVNPDRVSEKSEKELRDSMEQGLQLRPESTYDQQAEIKFCPTEQTLTTELQLIASDLDITSPTLLVVPEGLEVDTQPEIDTYKQHSLLKIEEYESSRFWSFVLNLYGRFEETPQFDAYFVDKESKGQLVRSIDEREVRNTIETLYDQLNQVAVDTVGPFIDTYIDLYSLDNSNELIWEEPRLNSSSPFWTNGRIAEPTVALSYLLVLGPDYEPQRPYSDLHDFLQNGMNGNLVSTSQTGFSYSSYFNELFTRNSYAQSVNEERHHYAPNGSLDPGMRQLEDALTSLAEHADRERLIANLNDSEKYAKNGEIPIIGVEGLPEQAYPLLRATLIRGLVTGSDPELDVVQNLEDSVEDLQSHSDTVQEHIERVEAKAEQLTPPEVCSVGAWISVTTDRLDMFKDNLSNIIAASEDLIDRCNTGSGAEVLGYNYWFFLKEYEPNIGDSINDFSSDIGAISIEHINDARNLFSEAYRKAQSSDAIPLHFDSTENVLSQLEDFGDNIFDLKHELGGGSLSLPEDRDDLDGLNNHVNEYIEELQQLNYDLETIDSKSESVREEIDKTKDELQVMLLPPEVTVDD